MIQQMIVTRLFNEDASRAEVSNALPRSETNAEEAPDHCCHTGNLVARSGIIWAPKAT